MSWTAPLEYLKEFGEVPNVKELINMSWTAPIEYLKEFGEVPNLKELINIIDP